MISDNISHQGRKTKVTRVFGGRLTFKLPSLTKVSNSFRSGGGWVEPEQVDTGYGAMSSGEFSFIRSPTVMLNFFEDNLILVSN